MNDLLELAGMLNELAQTWRDGIPNQMPLLVEEAAASHNERSGR